MPFAWRTAGVLYLAAALLLGAVFLRLALAVAAARRPQRGRGALFHFSLLYLAMLFVAMAIDPLI